ncbi:hypothetical protein B0H12DRAFT_1079172 [Mycena haematopus]|nr:hypothetical protein B0H12DRAFT_1079172 [Mycena haematopus]
MAGTMKTYPAYAGEIVVLFVGSGRLPVTESFDQCARALGEKLEWWPCGGVVGRRRGRQKRGESLLQQFFLFFFQALVYVGHVYAARSTRGTGGICPSRFDPLAVVNLERDAATAVRVFPEGPTELQNIRAPSPHSTDTPTHFFGHAPTSAEPPEAENTRISRRIWTKWVQM